MRVGIARASAAALARVLLVFFQSPLRKWSSVFLLAVLALGGAYYYQTMSLRPSYR